jgi:hypothetical protein
MVSSLLGCEEGKPKLVSERNRFNDTLMMILIAVRAEPMLEMLEAMHSGQLKLTKVLPKYWINRG